jgi:hypothetical protein
MRGAVVDGTGLVTNVIELNQLSDWPGAIDAGSAGIGWSYANGTFTAPPPPAPVVPAQVTRWQAMQQMLATPSFVHASPATVFSDMQTLVTTTGGTMLLAWQNQQFVYRNGPFIAGVMAPLGLTSAALDTLFIAAALLPQ